MFASTLTYVAFELIAAIDKGCTLSINELEHELDYGNDIFALLSDQFPGTFDFSLLSQLDKEFLIDNYSDIHFTYGPGRFGIENNAVTALLAYTIELARRERFVLREKGHDFQLQINPSLFSGRNDAMV